MKCEKCGKELTSSNQFCPQCGTRVARSDDPFELFSDNKEAIPAPMPPPRGGADRSGMALKVAVALIVVCALVAVMLMLTQLPKDTGSDQGGNNYEVTITVGGLTAVEGNGTVAIVEADTDSDGVFETTRDLGIQMESEGDYYMQTQNVSTTLDIGRGLTVIQYRITVFQGDTELYYNAYHVPTTRAVFLQNGNEGYWMFDEYNGDNWCRLSTSFVVGYA